MKYAYIRRATTIKEAQVTNARLRKAIPMAPFLRKLMKSILPILIIKLKTC